MKVRIHKNLDKYKGNVILGLSAREVIHSIIAIVISVVGIWFLRPLVGINLAVWITILFVFPIGMNGFYNNNGMTFFQSLICKIKFIFQPKLHYESTENENIIDQYKEYQKRLAEAEISTQKKKARNQKIISTFFDKKED